MSATYRIIAPGELDSSLLGAWRSIQSGNAAFDSPYFSPEFTQLVGGVRGDVRVAIIENGGRPVGFFPHQRGWMGKGLPVGGPLSDYHGIIALPGSQWDISALIRAARLSVWTFDHLVDADRKLEQHVTAVASSPQMDLSAGYEQYAQSHRDSGSDYIRKTEGLARKLGREVDELRFALHEPGSAVIEQLIRWKRDQYHRAGTPDVFGVAWTRRLLEGIAATETGDFAGVCSALRVGDRLIAVHMGMRSRTVLHYWFPAYAPEFAKFSSGIILLLRMAQALAGTGVRKVDLGKGDEQYKQRLKTGAVELREGFIELPSLLASARRMQRAAESRAGRGGLGATLRLPLRALSRLERTLRFR